MISYQSSALQPDQGRIALGRASDCTEGHKLMKTEIVESETCPVIFCSFLDLNINIHFLFSDFGSPSVSSQQFEPYQ